MIMYFVRGFLISFAFLNLTLLLNLGILKIFIAFNFQPGFLFENFSVQGLILFYIFLTFIVLITYIQSIKDFNNLLLKSCFILVPLLFFVWYCDIFYFNIFNELFIELSSKDNLIKLK